MIVSMFVMVAKSTSTRTKLIICMGVLNCTELASIYRSYLVHQIHTRASSFHLNSEH